MAVYFWLYGEEENILFLVPWSLIFCLLLCCPFQFGTRRLMGFAFGVDVHYCFCLFDLGFGVTSNSTQGLPLTLCAGTTCWFDGSYGFLEIDPRFACLKKATLPGKHSLHLRYPGFYTFPKFIYLLYCSKPFVYQRDIFEKL